MVVKETLVPPVHVPVLVNTKGCRGTSVFATRRLVPLTLVTVSVAASVVGETGKAVWYTAIVGKTEQLVTEIVVPLCGAAEKVKVVVVGTV